MTVRAPSITRDRKNKYKNKEIKKRYSYEVVHFKKNTSYNFIQKEKMNILEKYSLIYYFGLVRG